MLLFKQLFIAIICIIIFGTYSIISQRQYTKTRQELDQLKGQLNTVQLQMSYDLKSKIKNKIPNFKLKEK